MAKKKVPKLSSPSTTRPPVPAPTTTPAPLPPASPEVLLAEPTPTLEEPSSSPLLAPPSLASSATMAHSLLTLAGFFASVVLVPVFVLVGESCIEGGGEGPGAVYGAVAWLVFACSGICVRLVRQNAALERDLHQREVEIYEADKVSGGASPQGFPTVGSEATTTRTPGSPLQHPHSDPSEVMSPFTIGKNPSGDFSEPIVVSDLVRANSMLNELLKKRNEDNDFDSLRVEHKAEIDEMQSKLDEVVSKARREAEQSQSEFAVLEADITHLRAEIASLQCAPPASVGHHEQQTPKKDRREKAQLEEAYRLLQESHKKLCRDRETQEERRGLEAEMDMIEQLTAETNELSDSRRRIEDLEAQLDAAQKAQLTSDKRHRAQLRILQDAQPQPDITDSNASFDRVEVIDGVPKPSPSIPTPPNTPAVIAEEVVDITPPQTVVPEKEKKEEEEEGDEEGCSLRAELEAEKEKGVEARGQVASLKEQVAELTGLLRAERAEKEVEGEDVTPVTGWDRRQMELRRKHLAVLMEHSEGLQAIREKFVANKTRLASLAGLSEEEVRLLQKVTAAKKQMCASLEDSMSFAATCADTLSSFVTMCDIPSDKTPLSLLNDFNKSFEKIAQKCMTITPTFTGEEPTNGAVSP